MHQIKVIKGDYNALSESGVRTGQLIGVFADEAEAQALASEMADAGITCKVSLYKFTPQEAKRAALLASFGQKYVPAHVEPAGKWVRA